MRGCADGRYDGTLHIDMRDVVNTPAHKGTVMRVLCELYYTTQEELTVVYV
jgi:hypothetical protein